MVSIYRPLVTMYPAMLRGTDIALKSLNVLLGLECLAADWSFLSPLCCPFRFCPGWMFVLHDFQYDFNMISIYFNMILYSDCIWIPILISSASLWNWHWGPWRRWTLWKWRVFLVCSSWWLATQPQELSTSWASWWRMSVWLKFCGTHPQSSCHSTFHHLSLHRILELQHHTFHLLVIQDEAFQCLWIWQDDTGWLSMKPFQSPRWKEPSCVATA